MRVFDVNLRAPFFSPEVIMESLQLATIFKLNQDEVSTVLQMLRAPAKTASVRAETDLPRAAGWLMARYPMQMVAITLGSEGSLLVRAMPYTGIQAWQPKLSIPSAPATRSRLRW